MGVFLGGVSWFLLHSFFLGFFRGGFLGGCGISGRLLYKIIVSV